MLVFIISSIAKIFPYSVLYMLLVRLATFFGGGGYTITKIHKIMHEQMNDTMSFKFNGCIIKTLPICSQMSTLPLAAASKLAQVMELNRIKTQGDVSKLTWSLAAYGCAGKVYLTDYHNICLISHFSITARLFTIIVEVKDVQGELCFCLVCWHTCQNPYYSYIILLHTPPLLSKHLWKIAMARCTKYIQFFPLLQCF